MLDDGFENVVVVVGELGTSGTALGASGTAGGVDQIDSSSKDKGDCRPNEALLPPGNRPLFLRSMDAFTNASAFGAKFGRLSGGLRRRETPLDGLTLSNDPRRKGAVACLDL